MRARKIGRVSEVLRLRTGPISIGRAICTGLRNDLYLVIKEAFKLFTTLEL